MAFAAQGGIAAAQDWKPTKDVEFVILLPAVGGGADIMARVLHKIMTEEKLVPVPIALVNKPGGGGAVGIGYMSASRKADPHTIVLVNGTTQITPILTPEAEDADGSAAGDECHARRLRLLREGRRAWKTAADFVKDAKARPPKTYNFSTGGTTDVMAVTVLAKTTGTELNMINFNSGGEALTALLGGHVHASLGNPLELMGHLKSGAVRAIGVFRGHPLRLPPEVPTIKEQGINAPNFQMWRGVAIPKGAPAEAAKYWEGVLQKVAASPQFKAYLKDNAASEAPIAGANFVKFLDDQDKLYRDLLKK